MDQPEKKPMKTRDKIAVGLASVFLFFLALILFSSNSTPQGQVSAAYQAAQPVATARAPLPAPLRADQYPQVAAVAEPVAAPQAINPKTVAAAVDANKARAERDWNSKYVQFTAEVTDISTFLGPSVQFGKVSGQAFSLIHFLCMPASEEELIPYTKGEKATVRGVIEVGIGGVIKLNDCQYVS